MATKTAEKVVEAADVVDDIQDLVEDTVELAEDGASWFVGNRGVLIGSALVVGIAIGATAAYFGAKKKLEAKYQKIADEQIADVKSRYTVQRVVENKPSLSELVEKQIEQEEQIEQIIESSGYLHYDKVEPAVEEDPRDASDETITVTQAIVEATLPRERNVFESDEPDTYFDFEEELERRKTRPLDPFVITQDEFNENDSDYDQQTLTYYDGDDVLADSNDQPLDNLDRVAGVENMLRFGHGSGDPNIVYIRNARLEVDFEVVHSDGKFAKEVLGYDDELKHANRRPVRRFRPSDE